MAERPIFIGIRHHRNDNVTRRNAAALFKLSDKQPVKFLLLRLRPWARRHLEKDDLIRPRNIETRVLDDHTRRRVLMHKLIAITRWHSKRGQHGPVSCIQQRLQLSIGAALNEIKTQ